MHEKSSRPLTATLSSFATRRTRFVARQGKAGKKATPAKKAARAPKNGESRSPEAEGNPPATLQELMAATDLQPHSLRGFTSGTLGKRMGLSVESPKGENGQRTYSLKS